MFLALDLPGYAIGGVSVGEPATEVAATVKTTAAMLPEDRPRYLMGVGRPQDLLQAVAAGVDLFDCVIPSRNARHGLLFTRQGRLRIRNARFKNDPRPPEPGCDCPTCQCHSRSYLRHLVKIDEALGARLATLHNLHFYLRLLAEARLAIAEGRFEAYRRQVMAASDVTLD